MRIGIDARLIGGRSTGDRTYWRGLLSGLSQLNNFPDDEYILYVSQMPQSDEIIPLGLGAKFEWRVVNSSSERLWSILALPKAAKRDRVDLVHVQYSVSPFFSMPVVTSIHDISFRKFPEMFSPKDRFMLNTSIPFAARKAKAVIGVSESTRRDLIDAYGLSPKKVFTTHLAADKSYRRLNEPELDSAKAALKEKYGIDGPFVLAVGVLQPRKNLPLLVNAFKTAKAMSGFAHNLVITGKRGWLTSDIDAALAVKNVDEESLLILTGYVPDEDLPLLYNCADLFCYPSLYEGFGLPPLEAMACGCPVLVSNTSSLPEVVGNAGKTLDPNNPGAWIDSISKILGSAEIRAHMSDDGVAQAGLFDWAQTARLTRDVYEFAKTSR